VRSGRPLVGRCRLLGKRAQERVASYSKHCRRIVVGRAVCAHLDCTRAPLVPRPLLVTVLLLLVLPLRLLVPPPRPALVASSRHHTIKQKKIRFERRITSDSQKVLFFFTITILKCFYSNKQRLQTFTMRTMNGILGRCLKGNGAVGIKS
jgi:hypothetical protein